MRPYALVCAGILLCLTPADSTAAGSAVRLPGPHYEILRSGPAGGAHPRRSDEVAIRYVGTLSDGRVFSTSARDGADVSTFPVRTVIPGFSALIQLMRPGDRWRFTIPAYLAYGPEGKRLTPSERNLKRDVPPDSILIFDVELVSIVPAR
ncbi:FKBP-type peptidyl-prolyl cis-trans isomerase [Allosphingosinicella deserti]|uniref:FKBP-type peptidyl-prolyl cis-trans isomerase n=1 Tax=Allosphingosinicella deserti TaxID=2116704 RepID=UPI00130501AB|nr:FKBP-type peptidyl-prolyl cis-trans isomerase [Sphingomonas deserti]